MENRMALLQVADNLCNISGDVCGYMLGSKGQTYISTLSRQLHGANDNEKFN
jgi:hypothetical protein